MRDAAGDSGEFYTPRVVVKFIVAVIDPRLGETVLILRQVLRACGSIRAHPEAMQEGGRLCQAPARNAFGIEPKSLPYLLCQMNLLLHGLEYPEIDPGNALRFPLREIGDRDRVDIIMTNPPLAGGGARNSLKLSGRQTDCRNRIIPPTYYAKAPPSGGIQRRTLRHGRPEWRPVW